MNAVNPEDVVSIVLAVVLMTVVFALYWQGTRRERAALRAYRRTQRPAQRQRVTGQETA